MSAGRVMGLADIQGAVGSRQRVIDAIATGARASGSDFDYLLRTAERESSLQPDARARTSSATGLFQFIDQTWLATVKTAGTDHGLAEEAALIERDARGRYVVADDATRRAILALRNDPEIATAMAGAFTEGNRRGLTAELGRQPTDGELYIAHFMGLGGATALIRLAADTPDAVAARHFPRQAEANTPIFYARDGAARTAAEVYANLVARHETSADPAGGPLRPIPQVPGDGDGDAAWLRALPKSNAFAIAPRAGFQSLYATGGVSSHVVATWSGLSAAASARDAAAPAPVLALESAANEPAPAPGPSLPPARPQPAAPSPLEQFFAGLFGRGVTP